MDHNYNPLKLFDSILMLIGAGGIIYAACGAAIGVYSLWDDYSRYAIAAYRNIKQALIKPKPGFFDICCWDVTGEVEIDGESVLVATPVYHDRSRKPCKVCGHPYRRTNGKQPTFLSVGKA